MLTDAMVNIYNPHKPNKMNDRMPQKRRNSLPRTPSNPVMLGDRQNNIRRGNSFIIGQKLRESKWFRRDEEKIVCAVLESGFIVEKHENNQENTYGIVMWVPGYEKSKDPYYMTIYTLVGPSQKLKVQPFNLLEFWTNDSEIRINNKNDKTNNSNNDDEVRRQIKNAETRKFQNSEHFVYFCRYEKPPLPDAKKISESKWSPSNILARFRTRSLK
ncbi:hypothetical protein WA026_020198 [Henosepilachna vigintioctopunctata]|uniref:BAH domain-containing protein n=1 Tax=Henosepilachna vigintioctopunctata TaxID=420089 RepID=A0AAW1U4T8_9CUCU